MAQTGVITIVFTLVWFSEIAMRNGRLFEFFCMLVGIGFFGLVAIGMQLNKPRKGFKGFNGFEQERIGFALAASKMLPAYKQDLEYDAWVITQTMIDYNLVPNKKYIREVMHWHLRNTPEYVWDIFGQRASNRKVYAH